jgi:hypothetical protein
MKTLTDWFDLVLVINCRHRPDRRARFFAHISETGIADPARIEVLDATIGDWTTVPDDWKSGRGAWGCLRSHQRALERALHDRCDRYVMRHANLLVLEDDVFFLDGALEKLNEFMPYVPSDWGQIYLGGQHRKDPEHTGRPGVLRGRSVNRTHAYAVNGSTMQHMYRHISYATDYRGTTFHVDHQLERAHQRGDWNVYCPDVWICGQEEGTSNINGKFNERKTWIQTPPPPPQTQTETSPDSLPTLPRSPDLPQSPDT